MSKYRIVKRVNGFGTKYVVQRKHGILVCMLFLLTEVWGDIDICDDMQQAERSVAMFKKLEVKPVDSVEWEGE